MRWAMGSTRTRDEQLQLFIEQVEKLRQRRIFADGLPKLTLHLAVIGESSVRMEIPDQEDFRSFMLDFRRFTLDQEDVHFLRICNILGRDLTDTELQAANSSNRAAWKEAFEGDGEFIYGASLYRVKDFFNLVVNGRMFHLDRAKADEFDALPTAFQHIAEFAINQLAIECSIVLHLQSNVVRKAFQRQALSIR